MAIFLHSTSDECYEAFVYYRHIFGLDFITFFLTILNLKIVYVIVQRVNMTLIE